MHAFGLACAVLIVLVWIWRERALTLAAPSVQRPLRSREMIRAVLMVVIALFLIEYMAIDVAMFVAGDLLLYVEALFAASIFAGASSLLVRWLVEGKVFVRSVVRNLTGR